MNVHYISDQNGKRTAVVVPIKEWNRIRKKLDLPDSEPEKATSAKKQLLDDTQAALKEVKQHREGKTTLQSLDDFLNEL
jgi:hypothetical protein